MFNLYEVQVETPMGAFLNVLTTAHTEAEARGNVSKLLDSFATAASPRMAINEGVGSATIKAVEVRVK